jgi:hypothetical protein
MAVVTESYARFKTSIVDGVETAAIEVYVTYDDASGAISQVRIRNDSALTAWFRVDKTSNPRRNFETTSQPGTDVAHSVPGNTFSVFDNYTYSYRIPA